MDKTKIRLLVVDDERALCAGVQEALQRDGYRVDAAHDGRTALGMLGAGLYNVVVTDIRMAGGDGEDLLRQGLAISRDTQFVLMTAYGTVESAVAAMRDGAYDYLPKPLDLKRLRAVVARALEYQALVTENHELRLRLRKHREPDLLLGSSEAMRQVTRLAEELARTDVTVLIEGESGTGKELVARLIHLQSARAARPFVSVNCAALPEPLLEAELFGHRKGAFTGAIADKPGRFQLADGGTLFLDEIGDLLPKGQGDLLRVLEDGTFRMIGGTEPVRVNVRVIVATNQNLPAAVAAGKFREDLFYRLQVVPVTIPPLREHAEDIPELVDAFLAHFCARHRRGRKQLSADAMQACQHYSWPGNVRQLRNTVERLVVTCASATLTVADLPDFLLEQDRTGPSVVLRAGMSLAEAERILICQTLTRVTSNRAAAAAALGISRRALQYKIKQYGLRER